MFNKVLVGVDGRAGGRDAIALARALAASPGRLVLAHVEGARHNRGRFGTPDTHAQAHHLVASVRVENGLTCPIVVARNGSPAAGLHRLVEHERADLLVIGSSHRGSLGRVLLGDDSLAALDGARCAVAIAPHGYVFASPTWRAVGVGDDGSSESVVALQVASDIAREHDAQVQILSAMAPQPEERLRTFSRGVDLLVVARRETARWVARSPQAAGRTWPGAAPARWSSSPGRSARQSGPRLADHLQILACS